MTLYEDKHVEIKLYSNNTIIITPFIHRKAQKPIQIITNVDPDSVQVSTYNITTKNLYSIKYSTFDSKDSLCVIEHIIKENIITVAFGSIKTFASKFTGKLYSYNSDSSFDNVKVIVNDEVIETYDQITQEIQEKIITE